MKPLRLQYLAVIMEELALVFDDGLEIYISLQRLRQACPCAKCQGEPDAIGRVIRPLSQWNANSYRLTKIEPVGGYALQCYWADGHATGIYSLAYLRELATPTIR